MNGFAKDARPRIGVALGGGSARGFAHIGALASLERHDLAPDVIAGTSFGAIIGALYASGQSVAQMQETSNRFRKRDMPALIDFGLHKAALFSGDKLETFLDTLVEGRHFSDLEREFVVVTTDLRHGRERHPERRTARPGDKGEFGDAGSFFARRDRWAAARGRRARLAGSARHVETS